MPEHEGGGIRSLAQFVDLVYKLFLHFIIYVENSPTLQPNAFKCAKCTLFEQIVVQKIYELDT